MEDQGCQITIVSTDSASASSGFDQFKLPGHATLLLSFIALQIPILAG
jgi:hypothetical protein